MKAIHRQPRTEVLAPCDAGEGKPVIALRSRVSASWMPWTKQERRKQRKLAPSRGKRHMPKRFAEANRIRVRYPEAGSNTSRTEAASHRVAYFPPRISI